MKKLLILLLIAFTVVLTGCVNQMVPNLNFNNNSGSQFDAVDYYTGSEHQGNYVYGAAMNLAWNDLADNILHEKLQLNTKDKTALKMANKLNQAPFNKNDLDEASYYIKSGYGQKTVNEINQESAKKFSEKSFGDLKLDLEDEDIIAYAYFLKEVEYLEQFKSNNLIFNNSVSVNSFYAGSDEQRANVKILAYENDDKFIIKLLLKDDSDELILAKGYDMTSPQEVMQEINRLHQNEGTNMEKGDRFEAPKLNLDMHRDYDEMTGQSLANTGFTQYRISKMFEDIKFKMDEKGAKVENQAVILVTGSSMPNPIKYKKLILDKAYWVVMKKTSSYNPYFILGVKNTELMEKN